MMDFAPVKTEYADTTVLNAVPFVGFKDDVLTPEECDYLIALASGKMQRAKVSLDKDSDIIDGRSGSNCWLRYTEDETVRCIGQRIADRVGIPLENAEAMQVIHYGPDQEYRSHYDAYDLTSERGQRCCRYGGQRLVTALVYLNDVTQGGGTRFAKLDTEVKAKQGRMALFNNVGDDYLFAHKDSLHAGEPVVEGEKWAFNIWFHARPMTEKQDFQLYPNIKQATAKSSTQAASALPSGSTSFMANKTNRATHIFQHAINQLDPILIKKAQPICFTYWDTYGDSHPDLTDLSDATRVLKLIDRRITNPLANKAALAQALMDHNLESLAPKTYFTVHDAVDHKGEPTPIWFIKNAYGTGGKGMQCVANNDLANIDLKTNHIIQAGVTELALFEGKKFTVRVYCLVWRHKIYLYQNGFLVVHGVAYDPDSTDYRVQIDHTGYQNANGHVKMIQLLNYPDYARCYPSIKTLIKHLSPVLEDTRLAADDSSYTLLGIDVLLRNDGSARLLEINTVPNFIHTYEIINHVNIPFFTAALRTMLGDSSVVLEDILES